jgi:hypothetical protein
VGVGDRDDHVGGGEGNSDNNDDNNDDEDGIITNRFRRCVGSPRTTCRAPGRSQAHERAVLSTCGVTMMLQRCYSGVAVVLQ